MLSGQQKSGSTWLWELLRAHPCLISAAQPHYRMGAITTKETYYFTSAKLGPDARELLIPWMGYSQTTAMSDDAAAGIGNDWFEHALAVANVGIAATSAEYTRQRSYASPSAKLQMKACKQYYLFEATPHSINSPVAARRMKALFPESKAIAVLKEPALRMHSAYNQFSKPYQQSCSPKNMAPWCPVYRYYQLRLPTFEQAVKQEVQYLRAVGASVMCGCIALVIAEVAAFVRPSTRAGATALPAYCNCGNEVRTNRFESMVREMAMVIIVLVSCGISCLQQCGHPHLAQCCLGCPCYQAVRKFCCCLVSKHICAGCSFEGKTNPRSWMSCFGCTAMDPWKHKRDNIHIGFHPYIPSAALSMYEPMLRAWTEHFPMKDLRIINYHDLVTDQLETLNHVLRFAGAPTLILSRSLLFCSSLCCSPC